MKKMLCAAACALLAWAAGCSAAPEERRTDVVEPAGLHVDEERENLRSVYTERERKSRERMEMPSAPEPTN